MTSPYNTRVDQWEKSQALTSTSGTMDGDRPSMMEVYEASAGLMEREGLSVSRDQNWKNAVTPRNESIDEMIDQGLVSDELLEKHTTRWDDEGQQYSGPGLAVGTSRLDYSGLAQDLYDSGHDVRTDEDVEIDLRVNLKRQREADEATLEEATGFGSWLAEFGGAAVTASVKDPVNLLMMGFPVIGQVKSGGTVLGAAARTGIETGIVNAATEAAIQFEVVDYKEDIASPYTWSDGLFAVGAAGVFGGLFGAAAGGAGRYFNKRNDVISELTDTIDAMDEADPQRAALTQIIDDAREYIPVEAQDVTPERMAEIESKAAAVPDRAIKITQDDGTVVSVGDAIDEAANDVKVLDEVITCMIGGASG